MGSILVDAPAKINLTLDIKGTLENGYHIIESFIQPVSLSDKVTITNTNSGDIVITCDKKHIPLGDKNLCHKAAKIFFEEKNIQNSGLLIDIKKNIPDQAGLGGGSADAAATLRGLSQIYGVDVDSDLGFKVGADVAFCIENKSSFVTGMGEKITFVKPLPDCSIVIVKPITGSSTKDAYAKYDTTSSIFNYDIGKMANAIELSDINMVCNSLYNIFESLIDNEEVLKLKDILISGGALGSSMSGSGTAVFGIFNDSNKSEKAVELLKETYDDVYLCKPYRV